MKRRLIAAAIGAAFAASVGAQAPAPSAEQAQKDKQEMVKSTTEGAQKATARTSAEGSAKAAATKNQPKKLSEQGAEAAGRQVDHRRRAEVGSCEVGGRLGKGGCRHVPAGSPAQADDGTKGTQEGRDQLIFAATATRVRASEGTRLAKGRQAIAGPFVCKRPRKFPPLAFCGTMLLEEARP